MEIEIYFKNKLGLIKFIFEEFFTSSNRGNRVGYQPQALQLYLLFYENRVSKDKDSFYYLAIKNTK